MSALSVWRVADAARFCDAVAVHAAYDDFVTEKRENSSAHKERARVAVPINARCAAAVIVCRARRARVEFADFGEVETIVAQK